MKLFGIVVLICLILFGIIPSCVKNEATVVYASPGANQNLTPLNPVKKGQPFIISAILPDSNASVRWTIRPSDSTDLTAQGNQVMISVTRAGTYAITANFYSPSDLVKPYDSSNYSIIINDSVSAPQGEPGNTISLSGGGITLVPVSSSGTLEFIVQTASKYNCTSSISAIGFYQDTTDAEKGSFGFYLDSATINISKANCGGIKNPATINVILKSMAHGVHPMSVYLNKFEYEGSVNVTDSSYIFTWPYTTGAIIFPMQIKK